MENGAEIKVVTNRSGEKGLLRDVSGGELAACADELDVRCERTSRASHLSHSVISGQVHKSLVIEVCFLSTVFSNSQPPGLCPGLLEIYHQCYFRSVTC